MKRKTRTGIGIVVSLVILLIILSSSGLIKFDNLFAVGDFIETGEKVIYTVPIMASIRCESIGDSPVQYNIPQNGFWISKSDIGAVTNAVHDIKVVISTSTWDIFKTILGGGYRISYKICDQNKLSCGIENSKSISSAGTFDLNSIPASINPLKNSIFIVVQKKSTIFSSWQNVQTNARLSYSFRPYGLVLYSPVGVGIKTVCSSSCSLNCPDIGVRKTIVSTESDTLYFDTAVNYISTWVDVSQKAEQLGGTIWNANKNQFCFGGFIYSAGRISTETGATYVYPETYVGKKDCCVGATISTTYTDKICQSDNTWKTIIKSDIIKCTSDFQCPNSGTPTCQNKIQSGWSCSGSSPDIGSFCQKASGTAVACCTKSDCASDQVCSGNKCVGGASIKPISPNKCISDNDCKVGSKCEVSTGICGSGNEKQIECKWYDLKCLIDKLIDKLINKIKSSLLGIFKLIISGIVALLSIPFTSSLLNKLKQVKNRRIARYLLAILFGIGTFLLLLKYLPSSAFWYMIGGEIIYFVVALIFGGKNR